MFYVFYYMLYYVLFFRSAQYTRITLSGKRSILRIFKIIFMLGRICALTDYALYVDINISHIANNCNRYLQFVYLFRSSASATARMLNTILIDSFLYS